MTMYPSFQTTRVRVSVVSGSTCAFARRFESKRFIGEAPMVKAEAAVIPGTGGTARGSLPDNRP